MMSSNSNNNGSNRGMYACKYIEGDKDKSNEDNDVSGSTYVGLRPLCCE